MPTPRFRPGVTVAAIIERNGRYLLVEEHTPEGLCLNNPAGHLEAGETPLQAVPTHSFAFLPTPFLWPLFDWKFDGWQWNQSAILIPNFTVLFLCYGWFLLQRGRPALRPERVRE